MGGDPIEEDNEEAELEVVNADPESGASYPNGWPRSRRRSPRPTFAGPVCKGAVVAKSIAFGPAGSGPTELEGVIAGELRPVPTRGGGGGGDSELSSSSGLGTEKSSTGLSSDILDIVIDLLKPLEPEDVLRWFRGGCG